MKQSNGKNIGKFFAYAISALTLSLSMVGCGKQDGGGGAQAVYNPYNTNIGCTACAPSMNKIVASATTRSINYANQEQAEMSLNFVGDSAQSASVSGYYGPIAVSGIMRVRVAKVGACNIPAGDYSISTSTPGSWSGQGFGNLQLLASGPVQLRLQITTGLIQGVTPAATDWAGATFPFLAKMRVYVTPLSIGGYCNAGNLPEYYFED